MQRTVKFILFFIHTFITSSVSQPTGERYPPNITSPDAPKVFYSSSNKYSVPCMATGTPVIKYSWFQVGRDTDITTDSSQPLYVDSATGTLQFADFTDREEGTFICKASNEFNEGKIKAVSFSPPVTVYRSRADYFSDEEKTLTATAYSYQVLLCDKKGDIVGSTIIFDWYIGRDTRIVNKDNGRLFVDNEGNLHFTYVKTEDTNLVEGLKCGVSIEGPSFIRLSAKKKFLKVIPEPNPQQIAPQLMYSNSPLQVKIYLTAKLECMFSGFDPQSQNLPHIKWYFDNGTQIRSTAKFGFAHENRVLTIDKVAEDDEKMYMCEASNGAGTSKKEELFLNVTGPPMFVAGGSPSDLIVPEGKDAVFNCNARSVQSEQQPGEPIWYINGIRRGSHTDPSKYVVSEGYRKLTVKNVKKDTDILCMQCYVENSEGGIWGDGCLTVILPIKVIQQPVTPQEIEHGDVIDLTVIATTDPLMTLNQKWEHNGTVYDNLDQIPFVKQRAINTSELSEDQFKEVGGLYTVTLYHSYDSKIIEINVVTEFKPVVTDSDAEAGFYMWIIGLIIGIIFLIIVIIIIFVVCRKKPEGDYNGEGNYRSGRNHRHMVTENLTAIAFVDNLNVDNQPMSGPYSESGDASENEQNLTSLHQEVFVNDGLPEMVYFDIDESQIETTEVESYADGRTETPEYLTLF